MNSCSWTFTSLKLMMIFLVLMVVLSSLNSSPTKKYLKIYNKFFNMM